jgi:8-oxo-dGTP pyrophosphatase MutT (NUDIX family)
MPPSPRGPWQVHHSHLAYDNPWISIRQDQVTNPSGGDGIYGVVQFKNVAVGVIPIDEEQHTWLVGQYRYPHDTYEWEIPEGGAGLGEDPVDCARRELREETGITAALIEPLALDLQLSNSTTDEVGHIYTARDLSFSASSPEPTEQLAVRRLPLADAIDLALSGQIHDLMSVLGLIKLRALQIA